MMASRNVVVLFILAMLATAVFAEQKSPVPAPSPKSPATPPEQSGGGIHHHHHHAPSPAPEAQAPGPSKNAAPNAASGSFAVTGSLAAGVFVAALIGY